MNYYALLVALVLVTALLLHGTEEKSKKYVIVACALLFAVLGLRDAFSVGNDTTTSYLGNFWRLQNMTWSQTIARANGTNYLFFIMTWAFNRYFSTDYQLYIALISLFVIFCFGHFVYRYSPSPLQSILYFFGLLLFSFHFSALKQSIAMSILLLAFDAIIDRKPIKFILLVLLAGQFHFPAIVFFPAYWLAKLHIGKTYLIVLSLILLITYVFRVQILNFMIQLYRDEDVSVDLAGVRFLRTKALIMVVIVAAAIVFRIPTKDDRIYEILLGFMGMAIVFQTFCGYNNTFERLADYYFQFSVVFIPMVFDKRAERESLLDWRLLETVDTLAPYLFCGFGIYRFLTTISNDPTLASYQFFFQH